MDITEARVRTIVEKVVARIAEEQAAGRTPPAPPMLASGPKGAALPKGDLGIFDDLDEAVAAARRAYEALDQLPLAGRNKIIQSIRDLCRERVHAMSEMAVQETSFGRVEDKVLKNLLAIDKTPGTEDLVPRCITGDTGLTLYEPAPFGVIGDISPCTNPTETIISNSIGMIASGNAVVFCPHPLAKNVSIFTVATINEAILKAGGPPNVLTMLRVPSIQLAQELMRHKGVRILVVTGGPDVVRQAMLSGKKVIGAGPGNPPVVVDETADLAKAGRDVVMGASLDNNIVCIDEKQVFVVASVADRLKKEMAAHGGYEVKGAFHLKKLEQLLLKENRGARQHSVINKEWVGQDAHKILHAIGIDADPSIRLVFTEVEEGHPFVWTELLTSVIPVVRVGNVDAAIQLAKESEHGFGHTATMHSNNLEKLSKMARVINVSLFVKNGPAYAGLGMEGEGHASFTIASPTGEGVTSAKNFSRERKCVIVDRFRIV